MLTLGDGGMPAAFVRLPGAMEARFTVSNAVDQPCSRLQKRASKSG